MKTTSIFCVVFMAATALANEEDVSCPTAEEFKQAIRDDTAKDLPHIVFQDGLRVQLQHPDTHLTAHVKFFGNADTPGFACQYYNYVGMVATAFYVDYEKAGTTGTSFWREDFRDSLTQDGKAPNAETMEVCMQRIDQQTHASVGCHFRSRN